MNLSLFQQIIGLPLLIIVVLLAAVLSAIACWLIFRVKDPTVAGAFLPLCTLPFLVSIGSTLFALISSVGLQLEGEEEMLRDPAFFLTLNLVPLVFGATASTIPALIIMLGRWMIVMKSSGIEFKRPPKVTPDGESFDPQAWVERDAEDYLQELSRSR